MAVRRAKPDPDGIVTARLAGTAGRYMSRQPLEVDAAVAELREIAGGRTDLLGEVAGRRRIRAGCGRTRGAAHRDLAATPLRQLG
jgi:hypothetical protein